MDLTLTSNDDEYSTEPELEVDVLNTGDAWDGELAQNIQMFWWADDGDNVYEVGETDISGGVKTLYNLATTSPFSLALADKTHNVWTPNDPTPDPLPGGEDKIVYIAKAWCMGTLTLGALEQDELGTDGPQAPGRVGGGFSCDGTLLDNKTQTDGVELNVVFRAEQARHNPDFLCNPVQPRLPTLTVNKKLLVDHGDEIVISDFALHIDGPVPGPSDDIVVGDNVPVPNLPIGLYTIYEVIVGDVAGHTFTTTFSGACTVGAPHTVTLGYGDDVVCNILNEENP